MVTAAKGDPVKDPRSQRGRMAVEIGIVSAQGNVREGNFPQTYVRMSVVGAHPGFGWLRRARDRQAGIAWVVDAQRELSPAEGTPPGGVGAVPVVVGKCMSSSAEPPP